ncbi:MarR family winged helix-turn-helix transcriptional regulator [Burkholderia glumae]|uniref:MarR family winged helix-turn-helix transcriptional regulator n=1 Tax=Burkholderia glumae TaxID=337 RepID=UPI0021508EA9|nr:MarR family transcriptional regulator [Burkholderia glumae]
MNRKDKTAQADPATARLGDFLCFAVYSANLTFGKAYKPLLDELGLTYTQYLTLVAVSEEQAPTVGRLGEKLFLESNTLTPILKKLEALGYLQRQRAARDERQVLISLTQQGWQLREELAQVDLAGACGLSPDQVERTRQAVLVLRDKLVTAVRGGGRQ